jgi:hypothetical protein
VPLVNTDQLTLIGGGSEWFWTAMSGVVLAVTFLAIYRQLRLGRSQGAIAQLEAFAREWNSERLLIFRRDVLLAARSSNDAAALPEGAASTIGNYWEGIAALTRGGHLDRRLLWNQYGNTCQAWWDVLKPYVVAARSRSNDPTNYEDFEWLVGVLDGLDRRSGAGSRPGPDAWRDRAITAIDEMLAVERSLREVFVVPAGRVGDVSSENPQLRTTRRRTGSRDIPER